MLQNGYVIFWLLPKIDDNQSSKATLIIINKLGMFNFVELLTSVQMLFTGVDFQTRLRFSLTTCGSLRWS